MNHLIKSIKKLKVNLKNLKKRKSNVNKRLFIQLLNLDHLLCLNKIHLNYN